VALKALPAELGQCVALHTLDLEASRFLNSCIALTSLPAELGQCAALHTLNLGGCRALTALPAELGHCALLQQFSQSRLHDTVKKPRWSAALDVAIAANPSLANHASLHGRRAI
jgi:hypothetical protein